MDYGIIKTAAERIHIPPEMKRRMIQNCSMKLSNEKENHTMKYPRTLRKSAAVFAALAICLTLSVTALAATGALQGFFRDITDYRGAVVGTSYEQATDEINMSVTVNGNELTVLAIFSDPQKFPYREAEKLGIAAYRIMDTCGKVVQEGAAKAVEVSDGQAAIRIPVDGIVSGDYRLIVTAFVSEKKADQPLYLNGYWEADFSK